MSEYMQRPRPKSRAAEAGGPDTESTSQLDIFAAIDTAETAATRRRADEGMTRGLHGEDVRIASAFEAEVRRFAATGDEFTPCEVLPQVTSRRSFGAVVNRLAREGVIVCVGARPSSAPSRNGALTRVWRGA